MEAIKDAFHTLRTMDLRQFLTQGMNLGTYIFLSFPPHVHDAPGLIVTSALIIWKTLILITGSESPVVVVLSGSMEPGFQRGDILFLHMGTAPIRTGEIVVFKIDGRDIPIVHRAIKIHEQRSEDPRPEIKLLTKVTWNQELNVGVCSREIITWAMIVLCTLPVNPGSTMTTSWVEL